MKLRKALIIAGSADTFGCWAIAGLLIADRASPPPLPEPIPVSAEVRDRAGELLRAYATLDGRWRMTTELDAVDPEFVKMLIAYEDKRFFEHDGIDPLAM